jgi:Mg2+-importing ATPase
MNEGLSSKEARERLKKHGLNVIRAQKKTSAPYLFFSQFKSPLTLLLLFAALIAISLHDLTDGYIIFSIVGITILLGFYQEKKSSDAIYELLQMVSVQVDVIRDGTQKKIHLEKVVPGDCVILRAGDMIPGDGEIVEHKDFFVDEASLTGESTPLEKTQGPIFMGCHVASGYAKMIVTKTGKETQFGKLAEHLKIRPPETAFESGLKQFGYLLMKVTLIFISSIFLFNMLFNRPFLESLLFSLALAVGFTPQLLPAIVTVNLSKGARFMAKQSVIVKRMISIQNFGAMNILCCDKTGTITQGKIQLHSIVDLKNKTSDETFLYAYLNAHFQSGYSNPIDQAILAYKKVNINEWEKTDEIPYDFIRKRITLLLKHNEHHMIITKGAANQVLDICKNKQDFPFIEDYHKQGLRVLAIATKEISHSEMTKKDESNMTLIGFVILEDPLKPHIKETLNDLKNQGIILKILTGDNHLVAQHIAGLLELDQNKLITGSEIAKMSDKALEYKAKNVNVFAEIEPNQKERIILALRKEGNIVGYLGDGINDVTAIHAADVGISVDSAVDVAKEAADIILLHKDLSVLKNGIIAGRKTFANTMKYIFSATSANFGNMFSMAGASLFLPFLPLLPRQILLTNLLTDLPEMTIATDNVDNEIISKPLHWNMKFIRNFMVVFGLISSIFDYCTFGILLYFLKAKETEFQTGWFLESVASAAIIALMIRTKKFFIKSLPSPLLFFSVIGIVLLTMVIPYTFLAEIFEFQPLPPIFYVTICVILILYITFVEIAKKLFYKKFDL